MIMARNEDGTYSQVGFVKDNDGIDTEYIYDKDGDIVFEKGFTRETNGTVPLTINGIGKDLKAWSITGNTVQNSTPTPDNPIMLQGIGEKTENLFDKNATDVNNGYISGYYLYLDGSPVKPSSSLVWNTSEYIEITSGNIALSTLSTTSSGNPSICFYDSSKNYIIGYSYNNNTVRIHTVPNEAKYCRISIDERVINQLMLNAGSTPLPYEPYGYKIPVVTRGKNLFNCNDESTLSKVTKKYTISNLDINKYYTCSTSFEKITGVALASIYFAGESSRSNGVWKDTPRTFKPDTNGVINIFIRHIAEQEAPAIFDKVISGEITIMVEEDSTATPYEPYHEPITTPIYLPTPLYSGEVMRSDGTITRSDGTTETFTAPQIPTLNGTTVIDVDTAVKPTEMYTKYKSSK